MERSIGYKHGRFEVTNSHYRDTGRQSLMECRNSLLYSAGNYEPKTADMPSAEFHTHTICITYNSIIYKKSFVDSSRKAAAYN